MRGPPWRALAAGALALLAAAQGGALSAAGAAGLELRGELGVGAGAGGTARLAQRSFAVREDQFWLDGRALRVLSGEIHYFRIVPEYWRDRLQRLRAMGLNAVTVYVAWNWHEAAPGSFDFSSPARDVRRFLELAHEEGLLVLLRPGPYICAEWDFGGLPAWLLRNGSVELRTAAEPYLGLAERVWERLLGLLEPLLYVRHGGPLVMLQVENEYGFWGDAARSARDAEYLRRLIALARRRLGPELVLFTTDPPNVMARGSLAGPEVLTLFDGCTDVAAAQRLQRALNPPGQNPMLCTETYSGWITLWRDKTLARRPTRALAALVATLLAASNHSGGLSLYMAHGGTNFGFWGGASAGDYSPDVTSYDYNAPVAEGGENGVGTDGLDKWDALRAILAPLQHDQQPLPPPPPLPPRAAHGAVRMEWEAGLWANLDALTSRTARLAFPAAGESFDCLRGFISYEARLAGAPAPSNATHAELDLGTVHDRALLFVDGVRHGEAVYRGDKGRGTTVRVPRAALRAGANVTVLVEHMGRANFGNDDMPHAQIGLLGGHAFPKLDGASLAVANGWLARCLDFERPRFAALRWARIQEGARVAPPVLRRGALPHPAAANKDTFLSLDAWGRGVVWVDPEQQHTFNLGRYWAGVSPQHALYVPGPTIGAGAAQIVVLELERAADTIESLDHPLWD